MDDWTTRLIQDVMLKTPLTDPKKTPDVSFLYVDVSGVSNKTLEITTSEELLGKDAPSRARRIVSAGDVIFATVRPTLRRIAIVPDYLDGQVVSTGYFVFKPTSEVFNRFLFYYLQTQSFMGKMESLQSGASYPAVNDTQVKGQSISYPPIPEQQRIVAILDQAFADIEKTRANAEQNLKNARELFDSYLNQVFNQRGEGWVEYNLKDIVTLKSGTTVKKELEKTAGDIAYIKVSGMSLEGNEKEITTANTFLNGTEINSSNVLPVGTTIFPKRGGAIATNKKRITAIPLCIDLNTMGVIPKKAFILPLYLYFFFKTFDLLSISNGTTIPQINNYSFDDLKLSVPDIETQETLIKKLTQIETSTDDLSFKYEAKLNSLDELKKSLLHQAFSGELTKTEGHAA